MRKLFAILLLLPMLSLAQTAASKKAATKAKPAGLSRSLSRPTRSNGGLRLPSFLPALSSPFWPVTQ